MILKTMDGVVIRLTKQELDGVMEKLKQGTSHIMVRQALIPRSSIALYPDEMWDAKANTGRLHDGTRVIKEFGRWKDLGNSNITILLEHYPEAALDQVMSEYHWNEYRMSDIPAENRKERYALIMDYLSDPTTEKLALLNEQSKKLLT